LKILFILEEFPYPPLKSGVTKYQYEILKRLSPNSLDKFEIDIACYDLYSKDDIFFLKSNIKSIGKIFSLKKPNCRLKNFLNYLSKAFIGYFFFEDSSLNHIISENQYKIIYVAPERTYFNFKKNIPVFLNAMDSLSKYNYSLLKEHFNFKPLFKSIIWLLIELRLIRKSTIVSYVSTRDIEYISRFIRTNNLFFSPVGVDYHLYSSGIRSDFDYSILFTGNFAYQPNSDAANFLISEIFPEVKKLFPGATLWLVGMNPPPNFFGHKDIHVTGFVEDISEFYRRASIFLCPLKIGAGMKTKILEAMASGIPVISSDIGMEGIEFAVPGKTHLSANSLEQYLAAILDLFTNPSARDGLSSNAKKLISEHYDWNIVAKRLFDKIEAAANV
jgi:glycosyltransferase involved in cell wall biosynthesis